MSLKLTLICFVLLLKIHDYKGCSSADKKHNLPVPAAYDLNTPQIVKLPAKLDEISGLWFYPKDTSVFAIVDEAGILYKIYLHRNSFIQEWIYDKKRDFEDIVIHDSTFYVLISNGDIETLNFKGDSIQRDRNKFPDADKNANEFESLYYDDSLHQLIMLCKNCADDKKKSVSAWGYDPVTKVYTPQISSVDVTLIGEKTGVDKMHLKPSATAINPITNELFILASVNHLLIIADRNGNAKEVYQLDPALYKQPEGITFTPTGDMLISNESHDEGPANILIIKRKP